MASLVTVLAVLCSGIFWKLASTGSQQSEVALEYWELRRRRVIANISEILKAAGRRPAKRVFSAVFDESEGVLVTKWPVAVPSRSAHLVEMTELLRRSLIEELREASAKADVNELEELIQLGRKAQRHLDSDLCKLELQEAADFLQKHGAIRRQQVWHLLRYCDTATLVWIGLGLAIKVVSQIPGPVRMLYVSATVTAASKGKDGLEEFHAAALTSFWLFVAEKLLQFAGRITMFRGEQMFTLRLKQEVYAACLRQDMEFFDTQRCGELQTRLNVDTQEVCRKVLYFPVRFIQFSFFLVFNLAMLLSANPRLVSATLSVMPLALLGNVVLMKRLQKYYSKIQLRAEASAGKTQEVLSNIRTVRSFAREQYELERYERDQEYEARVLNEVNLLQGGMQPLLHTISELSFFVGLYYGGLLITRGLLSPGEITTLVQGTQACTGVITDLFDMLPEMSKAVKPASRLCELLQRSSSIEVVNSEVPVSPVDQSVRDGGVEFENVHFAYASRPTSKVLQGLSFTAKGGEVVALVGATGCGKSTIVNLLLRFYAPSKGEIRFDGRSVADYDVHWLRRQVGVVAQEPLLFGTSIRDNLLYGVPPSKSMPSSPKSSHRVDDARLEEVCTLANAWEFIKQLPEGLTTEVGERGVQLSGGQKQRIAIARAILKRPKVLLLDEATSALDVESEQVVQRALDEVIRASACTTLVIAHRLATIQNATKIVFIAEGVAQESGPPAELAGKLDGLFARMLQVQGATGPDLANGIASKSSDSNVCNGHR